MDLIRRMNEFDNSCTLTDNEIDGLKQIIMTSFKCQLKDMMFNIMVDEWFKHAFKTFEISELKELFGLARTCEDYEYYESWNNPKMFSVYDNLRDYVESIIYEIDERDQEAYWNMLEEQDQIGH